MKKKGIIIVIAIMAIALIGSLSIQAYYIAQALKLNQEQFEKNVFASLQSVSSILEKQNGGLLKQQAKQLEKITQSFSADLPSSLTTAPLKSPESILRDNARVDGVLENMRKQMDISELIEDLEVLDKLIASEVKDVGIDASYNYGVYSNKEEDFVIVNGGFVVPDGSSTLVGSTSDLSSSKFQVQLFPMGLQHSGKLFIHFPSTVEVISATIIRTMLAAIIFALCILGCFSYAMFVIFTQKKISTMKMDFVNNMTHEFKTPIATISLASDSINNPKIITQQEKVRRFTKIIKQENKRMLAQVEKVLQMATLEKKDFVLKKEELDINYLIHQAAENISLQLEPKGGQIKVELDSDIRVLRADKNHISNVLNNLLDNANKYTPNNPMITVVSKQLKQSVMIQVIDNGIGMTKEQVKHVFAKFYRAHTGNLHDVKGFGLGLSYVQAIINAHQGKVRVKSEPGKGSTFTILLPMQ